MEKREKSMWEDQWWDEDISTCPKRRPNASSTMSLKMISPVHDSIERVTWVVSSLKQNTWKFWDVVISWSRFVDSLHWWFEKRIGSFSKVCYLLHGPTRCQVLYCWFGGHYRKPKNEISSKWRNGISWSRFVDSSKVDSHKLHKQSTLFFGVVCWWFDVYFFTEESWKDDARNGNTVHNRYYILILWTKQRR